MSRRVVIQANGDHPFRVGSPGINADSANIFDLFFDGNQSPLRLFGTGFVSVPRLESNNVSLAWFVTGPPVIVTPSGLFPVFTLAVRASFRAGDPNFLTTVTANSGGIVAANASSNNTFYGFNRAKEAFPGTTLTNALINFMICRNYG